MWPDDSGGTGGLALGAPEYLNNGSKIQPKYPAQIQTIDWTKWEFHTLTN